MELQFLEKTQTLVYMLISQTFYLEHIVKHIIRSLVTRASHICSTDKLPSEIKTSKRFASWNNFPISVASSIIIKTLNTPSIVEDSRGANETSNAVTICFRVLYHKDKGVICKSQNGESGNGMKGMMGMSGIRAGMMGMRGIRVGMQGIRVGMMGMRGNQERNAGNRGGDQGDQGGNKENRVGNAGNQGENPLIGVEMMNKKCGEG